MEYEDGIRREYSINTMGLKMWHVSASDYYELMEDSYGQLHSGDTYVVRWQYKMQQCGEWLCELYCVWVVGSTLILLCLPLTGVRDLKGNLSKHQSLMGRERFAYFFWQGSQSSVNEKGASALMTVELDEENGPQVIKSPNQFYLHSDIGEELVDMRDRCLCHFRYESSREWNRPASCLCLTDA